MSQPTRVIVNADDFGLHRAVNRAVQFGFQHGIVTSCSLIASDRMRRADEFYEAVSIAQSLPALDVGLHFTLVGGLRQPFGYRDFLAAYASGCYPASRVETELQRQLDSLERAGIHPSHIDSHQHLHALPGIMRVVCRVAVGRGIPAVRVPLERAPTGTRPGRRLASNALSLIAAMARRIVDRSGIWHPDYFTGMAVSGRLNERMLLAIIARASLGATTEIVCHPGLDNVALSGEFPWGYDWESELAAVTGVSVKKGLAERGIALTSFRAESNAVRAAR